MSVLVILIAASILIAGGFLTAFLWSVRNGQFDDDYTPSVRMLFDAVNSPSDKSGEAPADPSTKQQTDT
jgi:cbb3-type cytochrome oxidase maturation protein